MLDTLLTHLGFYSPSLTSKYILRRIEKLRLLSLQHTEEINWHTAMKKLCDSEIKKLTTRSE